MKAILALIQLFPATRAKDSGNSCPPVLPEEVDFYFFGLDIVSLSAVSRVYWNNSLPKPGFSGSLI
jgi:hypothetical protein